MLRNPFTPVFGGKPDCFFGRKNILRRFEAALVDRGSEDRALFITGSRGYGKTALLEQLSRRASDAGWLSVDVGPDNPIDTIMRYLVPFDESTKTVDPEIEVSVFGTGGKLRAGSNSKTVKYSRDDFEYLFVQACSKPGFKLFVTVDEIQKVSLDDVALISGAFQMASRKGYDTMLAVAGLPYAHEQVIQHDGCTFLRRAAHESLGPLAPSDVVTAFAETFGKVKGLDVEAAAVDALVAASKGHPYVMQLEGFYAVEAAGDSSRSGCLKVDDVVTILERVKTTYWRRAIKPLVDEMPDSELAYVRAMARSLDDDRVARTGDIAQALGKAANDVGGPRRRLIDDGIVASPAHGTLVFLIPYLAEFLLEEQPSRKDALELVLAWKM